MERQYEINEIDLWFILRKINKEENIVLYWNGKRRDNRRDCAKIYYFKDDAIGGLVLARKRWNEPI